MEILTFWTPGRKKQYEELLTTQNSIHQPGFSPKPTKLNLLVNDICNSKCQMCNIWKQKKDKEISPAELEYILADNLFNDLRYIGVSGGEPTLRKDLPEIFRAIARKKPAEGTGIITNAINTNQVIERIEDSYAICKAEAVRFNIMVSLDGIGEIHDTIRGTPGSFNHALDVLRYFKNDAKIPISLGCTITKENAWHVEEFLDFCQDEGFQVVFRIAEFIDRLHNKTQTEVIRNFSSLEQYNLGLFFLKLENRENKRTRRKKIYRSIWKMLLEDAKRSCGCFWQITAVSMDCRGNLFYCSPHSPILESCLQIAAQTVYENNLATRHKIIKTYCDDCIHDYGGPDTIQLWREEEMYQHWRNCFANERMLQITQGVDLNGIRMASATIKSPKQYLIIGWYGTETAGDKAILAGLIYSLQEESPGADISLASIHPHYSRWTLREMKLDKINIIPAFDEALLSTIGKVDVVIMGGGPLMHIGALGMVLAAFYEAKQLAKETRIAGCGIGPLDRGEKFETLVQRILELSDHVELRDQASANWAKKRTGRQDILVTGDYAIGFVERWMSDQSDFQSGRHLNLYLRDWGPEYQGKLSNNEFIEIKRNFELNLATWIRKIACDKNLTIRLIPMHHFYIGNDDREFNRRFAAKYLHDLNPIVEKQPLSVDQILKSMREATISICMRFHSVLFANTLGVPFIAIDYTHGGKISGYLHDHQKTQSMFSVKQIAEGREISEIKNIM